MSVHQLYLVFCPAWCDVVFPLPNSVIWRYSGNFGLSLTVPVHGRRVCNQRRRLWLARFHFQSVAWQFRPKPNVLWWFVAKTAPKLHDRSVSAPKPNGRSLIGNARHTNVCSIATERAGSGTELSAEISNFKLNAETVYCHWHHRSC